MNLFYSDHQNLQYHPTPPVLDSHVSQLTSTTRTCFVQQNTKINLIATGPIGALMPVLVLLTLPQQSSSLSTLTENSLLVSVKCFTKAQEQPFCFCKENTV